MKDQFFSEMFVKGQCVLCGEKCNPDFIMHLVCAIAYDEKKKEMFKEKEVKKYG